MGSLKTLLPFLSKYKYKLTLSIFFNLLTAIFTLVSIPFVIPFFQILFRVDIASYTQPENIYDLEIALNYYFSRLIAISDRSTALLFVCFALLIVVFLRNLFRYLNSFFLIPVRNGLVRDIRSALFQAYTKLPISYFKNHQKGDLLSISSNDVVEVEWSVIRMIELVFKNPLIIIGSLIFMFWINVKLSILAIGLMVIVGIVMGGLSKNLKKKSKVSQSILGSLNAQLEGLLSGIKIVKAFGGENYFRKNFSIQNDLHFKKNNIILRRRDLASPLSEFLGVSLVIVLIYYGAQLVLVSDMRPETFFAFVFAFYNVIEPAKTLSTAYYNVQKGLASMDRINLIVDDSNRLSLRNGQMRMNHNWHSIEFNNVGFSYANQKVINGLNITLERDKSIAIVGRSGVGKSTFIDLLLRFYDPDNGEVLIDDVNIRDLIIKDYRSLFALVSQDPILFNGTIINNIDFGRELENNSIEAAIRKSNSEDFINERSEAKNAPVADNGSNFSMGQRQRLAIARAVAEERPILIIDEATTALDAEAEHKVLLAIKEAVKGKTTIIISHKFSLIKNVDMIYVMDNGRIVNSGKHEDLLKTDGLYKDLLSYQMAT